MKLPMIFACSLAICPAAVAQAEEDYFQQFVHYTIQVQLDTEERKLHGTETIFYKNNSPDTLREFYLHLYPNAYSSKNTPFMKDFRRAFNYSFVDIPKKHRGYLNISEVAIEGVPVTPKIDGTIAAMTLPEPLPPGGAMEVSLRFEEKIRKHLGRAGYRGDHYDLAQWYPKVVVYDENGFHPDQFKRGEFYGEFGSFDVYIEVPRRYVVAATGVVKEGDPGWKLNSADGGRRSEGKDEGDYKTVHFHAENVHDFAWSADPSFVVQDTTWNDVEIKSFFRKDHEEWRDTTLVHGVRAIEWLSGHFGRYPYPQVSIVDALLRGGMEYPMLVMDGRVSEPLVVHEIGHIYFYGILGNDERKEAWLDEGFTTFQTNWYLTERYGPEGITHKRNWYQRLTPQFTVWGGMRRRLFPLLRLGYGERIATRAEEFKHSYREMVYRKTSLALHALRYVVGEEDFARIMKEYYSRWKLKHVNEKRFQDVCEEISGRDLSWFFEEWLHTTKICDYRLAGLESGPSERGDGYTSKVRIERIGELVMPLKLEFTFADGAVETARLDGRLRTIEKTFEFPEKPRSAALNPDNEIMDINLSDNFIPRRRALQIDWPNNHYYPEDAYQIRHRPGVWYNDIDGLKAGYRFRGGYANWLRLATLGVYYGFKSGRVDFSASYVAPLKLFGNNATWRLSGYKMEGRQDGTLELVYRIRKELVHPPSHDIGFGLNYHELANATFVTNPETYQTRHEFAPYFSYTVDPQFDILETKLDFRLRIGREWFGARYKYTSLAGTAAVRTRPMLVPFDAGLRVFLGIVGGITPFQRKFSLAGGGPLAEDRRFWLRSPGAVWEDLNYHEPGHGNLRGYREGSFGVSRLLALNLEVGRSVPWLSKEPGKWLGTIKTMAFADVGTIFDRGNPIGTSPRVQKLVDEEGVLNKTLVDAGIGFRLKRNFPFYNLNVRFDVPFYVNHPEVNGESDETKYRYLFSLTSLF